MLTVFPPALDGLRPTKKGSAWLRVQKFRGSFDVVHFHYGPSVPFPQHSTPPRGDAVEFMFRREQSNSTGGTFTHVETSFTGAGFVIFCGFARSFVENGLQRDVVRATVHVSPPLAVAGLVWFLSFVMSLKYFRFT